MLSKEYPCKFSALKRGRICSLSIEKDEKNDEPVSASPFSAARCWSYQFPNDVIINKKCKVECYRRVCDIVDDDENKNQAFCVMLVVLVLRVARRIMLISLDCV
jgi:hypothetical protein